MSPSAHIRPFDPSLGSVAERLRLGVKGTLGRNMTRRECRLLPEPANFRNSASAHSKAAEDFRVVLAELGGDGAHPHTLPILIGVRMCGTSPNSGSFAYCTRPRWRTCGSANICA